MNGAQNSQDGPGFAGGRVYLVNVLFVVENTEKNRGYIFLTWKKNAELGIYCNTAEGETHDLNITLVLFSHAHHYCHL